jgi:hypothetical protein
VSDSEILVEVRRITQEWIDKQGHDRCWYYPDLFNQLVGVLGIRMTVETRLPSREEFARGCEKFQEEEYTVR